MKTTNLFLIYCYFLSFYCSYAQQKTENSLQESKDIIISYEVTYKNKLTEKQKLSSHYKSDLIVSFNANQLIERSFNKTINRQYFVLFDYLDDKHYKCYTSEATKYAIVSNIKAPQKEVISDPNSNKTILGFDCKKSIAMEKNKAYELYTTEAFDLPYSKNYKLNGFLLAYEGFHPYLGPYKVLAKKIAYFNLDDSYYSLDGLKIYTPQEHKDYKAQSNSKYSSIYTEMIGNPAPRYKFKTLSKKKIDSKKNNKVRVLNFWFSKSTICKNDIPNLNKLKALYADNPNVEFIAIANDKKYDLENILRFHQFNYELVADGRYWGEKFKVPSYPTNVIIDRNGFIRYYKVGGIGPYRVKQLSTQINKVLKNPIPFSK